LGRNPDTVLAPDFAFVSKTCIAKQGLTGWFYPAPPDLAVEILSSSDGAVEFMEKMDEWLEAGTRLIWVVNPEKKTIHVHASGRAIAKLRLGGTLEGEDVLPGLKIPVAEIFA